ncbi:hypothetical protein [Alicyclobacillus dauci]|uniref:Ead/Ea22-like family protein n=1 Tax=Alicyclobacillus dauci TaxID=1475485 RepID=A0ABY6Z6T3_9BACL|nr:hypothetical protein [Alicyclobacillus dauci]WAH38599.1 hypothetical protein NZD86_09005 [Alicyclobacillus dauci]
MALTREQVEQLIAASERATTHRGKWVVRKDTIVGVENQGDICEVKVARFEPTTYHNAEFIAQSGNLMPELARGYLQKDAEIQRKNAQIQRMRDELVRVANMLEKWSEKYPSSELMVSDTVELLEFEVDNIREFLADIDANSGADAEDGGTE